MYLYKFLLMYFYMYKYMYVFRDLESGLSKDLKDGEPCLRWTNAGGARGGVDVQIVRYACRKGRLFSINSHN